MKGILEFNTEEPYEKLAFQRATKADSAYLVILGIYDYLREQLKYNENLSEDAAEALEKVRDHLAALEENYTVDVRSELP